MTPKKVREFFSRLAAADPEPKGELEFATPYQLLVAVVLSAQATDKGVNRATRPLFREHPTPQAIAALGEEGLSDYLQTIGLYRTKAKNVAALSRLLLPELSVAEGSLPLAIVLFGTFIGVCWLGLMVICNTRLALALVRMHRKGEIVEWDFEATAAAAWCRRFGPVYRVVSWQNRVDLDNVLRSTLTRDSGRLKRPQSDSTSEEKPQ